MKQHTSRTPAVQAKAKTGFFNKKGPGTFFGRPASASGGGATIQPKLTVGSPNDPFEKEADATADQVVQRLADKSYAQPPVAVAGRTAAASAQTKPIFDSKADPKDEPLQRKSNDNSASTASPSVESGLRSSSGHGAPLPASTRSQMESGFGTDFSGVRIHNDSKASQLNKSLNAQAFAHGKDIYFDSGKYNPGSQSGQHLLAHELTHVVQQGAAGKPAISKKESTASSAIPGTPAASIVATTTPSVQLASTNKSDPNVEPQAITDLDNEALDKLGHPKAGKLVKDGKTVEVHFFQLPAKEYASPWNKSKNKYLEKPPYLRPNVERNTNQGYWWKKAAVPLAEAQLQKLIAKDKVSGKEFTLEVQGNDKIAMVGTKEQIAQEVAVPSWDLTGKSFKFDIEHKVDWQLAGGNSDVDHIDNLCLLQAKINRDLGKEVYEKMSEHYEKVIAYYKEKKNVTGLRASFEAGKKFYKIYTDSLNTEAIPVNGTIIELKDFEGSDKVNPLAENRIKISDRKLGKGNLLLYTSATGAGNIAPYNYKSKDEKVVFNGNAAKRTLKSILLKDVVKDKYGHVVKKHPNLKLDVSNNGLPTDHFRVDAEGFSSVLKDYIREVTIFSPVKWEEISFDIVNGYHATGTITTGLSMLQGTKITIELTGDEYVVKAEITSEKLKDTLPKPFHADYGSLYVSFGSNSGVTIGGEIGFSIDKVGQGSIHGSANAKGFELGGNFQFDREHFTGDIKGGYKKVGDKGTWNLDGTVILKGKKFKGVESLTITFSTTDQGLYGSGEAKLSMKAIETVKIEALAGNDGTLTITGIVHLGKLPKLKGGDGTLVATRKDDEWDFSVTAKLIPDLSFKGLTVDEANLSYSQGIFDVNAAAHFKWGKGDRIKGDFRLGVTNKPVSEDGKKAEGDFLSTLQFYGDGQINVYIAEGIGGAVGIHLTPNEDILLDGKVELTENKPLFELPPVRKNIFHFDQDIPLASCVVVTLSLNIHGGVDLYADMQPLVFDQGSYVALNSVSLTHLDNASIDAHLSVSSHLQAGVLFKLGIALQADLLKVIKARVGGNGTLDFRAIDASAKADIDAGWSADQGIKLKSAQLHLSLLSKLIASLSAEIRVFADLYVKEINIWSHEWELGSREYPLDLFGLGDVTVPLPVGDDGKVNLTQGTMQNTISNLGNKVNKDKVWDSSKQILDKDGKTTDDKQGQSNSVIRQAVLDQFHDPARFMFSGNRDYLNRRFGMYRDLKKRAEDDSSVNIDELYSEIYKCEHEEFEKFKAYLKSSTFDEATKTQMAEDFCDGRPTLNFLEKGTLMDMAEDPPKK